MKDIPEKIFVSMVLVFFYPFILIATILTAGIPASLRKPTLIERLKCIWKYEENNVS